MIYKRRLWLDFETRSRNDISRGTHVYAEDSRCLMAQYALDDEWPKVWAPAEGQPMPADLHAYLMDPTIEIAAHNAEFERINMAAWDWCKWYDLSPLRFHCTATAARVAGLPGGLEELCAALGLPEQYSKKAGKELIRLFCVPNKKLGRFISPAERPIEWESFKIYGIFDIISMREASKRTPQVFDTQERIFYAYTAMMNDRGLLIDRELVAAAIEQAGELRRGYRRQGNELVGNFRVKATDREFNVMSQQAILAYLKEYGIFLPDARAATLEDFLESPQAELLPTHITQLLATRLKVNKASVAKYASINKGLSKDGSVKGTVVMRGAGRTGRDAGRRIQPQNLARPVLVWSKLKAEDLLDKAFTGKKLHMEELVELVTEDRARDIFDDPMQVLSDCVRGTLIARPGKKFVIADLSSIEGRVLPWLANEKDELQYFWDYDSGKIKFDNYVSTYARSFNVSPESVTKAQRQIGKVQTLALGFEGGVGAFVTFAVIYRIDLEELARTVREVADPYLWEEERKKYNWFQKHNTVHGLDEETWTGCQYLVMAWRRSRPMTVRSWARAEESFRNALANPGIQFTMAHKTHVINNGGWLFVRLPSGRTLVYPHVHLVDGKRKDKQQLAFWGVNPFTKRWGINYTYSGRLIENITQAGANDVMMWNVPRIEQAGYPILMRVHDEVITETVDSAEFSAHNLSTLLAQPSHWCTDLPLAAAGFETYRYKKEEE